MKVLFLPDYDNPYQDNLASELDEEVVYGNAWRPIAILLSVHEAEDVSIVHLHWLDPFIFAQSIWRMPVKLILTTLQLLLIRLQGIRIVWTAHNIVSHESPYPRVERGYKHLFVRLLCSHLFVHSENIIGSLITEYRLPQSTRSRITVVPHGHYIDNYDNEYTAGEAKDLLDINPDTTVFLYFGQIRPYKGVPKLIEIFKSIPDDDLQLWIVGNPDRESLANTIVNKSSDDQRIKTVLKYIDPGDIQKYMNASDAVVLPYNEITTSGSVMLAMSFRRAVIAPKMRGLSAQIDRQGAILYDSDGALRDALLEALQRDLSKMGEHNYSTAARYDWADTARITSEVYAMVQN